MGFLEPFVHERKTRFEGRPLKKVDEGGGVKTPFECIEKMSTACGGGANRPTTRGSIRRLRKWTGNECCSET